MSASRARATCSSCGPRSRTRRSTALTFSAALEAPGVIAAFSGADLADLAVIPPSAMAGLMNAEMTQPLLATDKVRYVGEPVAVVVTEQPYQGEDALELVLPSTTTRCPRYWDSSPPTTSLAARGCRYEHRR